MNKLFQAIGIGLAALSAGAACNDPERLPDGERFSESVTGQPGVMLIDDMEDGSQYLLSDNGLTGLWYIFNDGSTDAVQEPALGFPMYRVLTDDGAVQPNAEVLPRPCPGGPETPFGTETTDECRFVARTWGTGQRGWGAGIGVDLNGEGGAKNPYDASPFAGIGFYATGAVRNGALRVNVQDVRTTPESAEAADRRGIPRCTDDADVPMSRCNDHLGTSVRLTPGVWTWIEIPFACMTTGGWGYPGMGATLLTSAVVGVQFQIQGGDPADTGVPAPNTEVMPFDFAIDNLSFLEPSRVANPVCPAPP
jgi:hypothetical protein